jgi:serine/threonine-protein kinase
MEYLDGRSLKRLIQEEGPLAPDRAIDLAVQILRAARFAHRRGIIHRDLKPHNVIVDAEGRAKVTDFGIARAGASDMTQTGSIMGTAQYLSPEQAQGHAVSAQSDIYSIGIILYEMLTGRVPFDGESAVTIALKQVSEQPVPPSQLNSAVPPGLDAAVMRALAKDPAQRYVDADAFIAALQGEDVPPTDATAIAGVGGPPLPTPPPPVIAREPVAPPPMLPPEERERESRWWWWLLALLLVAALIVGGVLLLSSGKKVTVPDVVGASQAAAEKALRDKGFSTDSTFETSTRRQGEVIGQDPSGGTQADKGSTVHLIVSGGPGQANVPSVAGLGRHAAAKRLTKAGFRVDEEERFDDTVPHDHVIATQPPEGTPLDKGSTVTLVVSKGPEQVEVPSEVGKSLDDARNELENLGFKVSVKRQESTEDPDTVLAQDPASGEHDKGSTVTLTVAKEPSEAEVPKIVGEDDTNAVSALQDAGFKVSITRQDTQNLDEDGIVLSQDPDGGRAKKGSTVTIVVGRFNPDLQGDGQSTTPTTTPTTP